MDLRVIFLCFAAPAKLQIKDLIELIESTGKPLIELMTVPDPALARPANSEFPSGFH